MARVVLAQNIRKNYFLGKVVVPALRGLSIEIEQGEFISLMGPSGSGKSTLLNLIGMLDMPTSGSIQINNQKVSAMNENERADFRLSHVGFVFQFFNLFLELSAIENTMLPMMLKGIAHRRCRERAQEVLELVGLAERMHHKPSELSGGEQQRVAIARSLINSPPLILADEPTGNLDTLTSLEIIQIFRQLNREHCQTIVLVTHEPDLGRQADRIIRLRDGEIEN